jgi:DNA-binding NtrC family response regulator
VTVPAQGLDAAALRSVAKLQSRRVRKLVAEFARTVAAGEVLHELMTAADGMRWTARRSALAMTGAVDAAIADAAREDGTAAGAAPTPAQDWTDSLTNWAERSATTGGKPLLDDALPAFERALIHVALRHTQGHRQAAAKLLGWGRNTLTRKLKELGMDDIPG